METLQSGRTDPWYMLDNAEICLKTLADEAPSRVPNLNLSSSEAASTVKLDSAAETIALERTKRAHAATNPLIALPEPEAGRSAVRRAVHRGSQGRDRFGSKELPAMGPESHGFGIAVVDAPQLSHPEGQRPHGRRPIDRGICLVDREFAESDHRQDPVAHPRNDGACCAARWPPCRSWLNSWKPAGKAPVPIEALMARAFAYADGRDPEQARIHVAPEDRAGSDANSATSTWSGTATGAPPAAVATAPPATASAPSAPHREPRLQRKWIRRCMISTARRPRAT